MTDQRARFAQNVAEDINALNVRVDGLSEKLENGGGAAGITPHIGDNGNWWIGEKDTGVKAAADSASRTLTITAAAVSGAALAGNLALAAYVILKKAKQPV